MEFFEKILKKFGQVESISEKRQTTNTSESYVQNRIVRRRPCNMCLDEFKQAYRISSVELRDAKVNLFDSY